MAQNSTPEWLPQVILSSPIIQIGIAMGTLAFGGYLGKRALSKWLGTEKEDELDALARTRLALEALAKVTDAQARLIELQQAQIEGHLDETVHATGKDDGDV